MTKKRLQSLLKIITTYINCPATGKGSLYLDYVSYYGGYDLREVINNSGGARSLSDNNFGGRGRMKGREMEAFLLGMIAGIELIKDQEVSKAKP